MMMSAPQAPLQNSANPNNAPVVKTPKACLFNLEQTYESRKKTDHEFMNWWLGTLVVTPVTFFYYAVYRFYRNIARRDSHFAKTHQFYTEVAETINAIAKDQGNRALDTDLRNLNQLLYNKEAQKLVKPIHWWLYLGVALVGGAVAGAISYFLAPLLFSAVDKETIALYSSGIQLVLQLPIIIYSIIILSSLMKNHASLERFESACLQKTRSMLLDLGVKEARDIHYEPQCKPRNFWLHFALSFVTLGLNWLYVDYQLITEPVKRFKEANRVQHQVVQALKQVFNKNLQHANKLRVRLASEQPFSASVNEEPTI
jgi:hypothetical protein